MAYKFSAIKVSQLVMDHVHNPQVLGLAKHIAKHGLNPMERIALIPHPNLPKLFIALEGNRRVCALKLLRDPMRGPDSKAQKGAKGRRRRG